MSRAEVLVTGFGPFPGVACNRSGWLAQMLARTHGAKVSAAVLPVCWDGAWAALEPLLEENRPRHVILFGVSHAARGFQLEQCAYNTASGQADAQGRTAKDAWLNAHGPEMRTATLPLGNISAALAEARLPITLSDDPGRYLCNATLYRTLDWAAQNGTVRAGFIHIPAGIAENSSAGPGLSAGDLLTGARLIVDTVLRADWPKPRSVPSAP